MTRDDKIAARNADASRFSRWARSHPAAFTALLMVLAMAVTVALLFQKGYSFVLYQGF